MSDDARVSSLNMNSTSILDSLSSKTEIELRFPTKLWTLLNKCTSGAIKWNSLGSSILIDRHLFTVEYLLNSNTFKTKSLKSFVRQLNMYGFNKTFESSRKVDRTGDYTACLEFKCVNFQRDRPDLLTNMKRKYKAKKPNVTAPSKTITESENCLFKRLIDPPHTFETVAQNLIEECIEETNDPQEALSLSSIVTIPLELLPINVTSQEVESQLTYENCYLGGTGHFMHDVTIDLSRMPQEGFSIIIGEQ